MPYFVTWPHFLCSFSFSFIKHTPVPGIQVSIKFCYLITVAGSGSVPCRKAFMDLVLHTHTERKHVVQAFTTRHILGKFRFLDCKQKKSSPDTWVQSTLLRGSSFFYWQWLTDRFSLKGCLFVWQWLTDRFSLKGCLFVCLFFGGGL